MKLPGIELKSSQYLEVPIFLELFPFKSGKLLLGHSVCVFCPSHSILKFPVLPLIVNRTRWTFCTSKTSNWSISPWISTDYIFYIKHNTTGFTKWHLLSQQAFRTKLLSFGWQALHFSLFAFENAAMRNLRAHTNVSWACKLVLFVTFLQCFGTCHYLHIWTGKTSCFTKSFQNCGLKS